MHTLNSSDMNAIASKVAAAADSVMTTLHAEQCSIIARQEMEAHAILEAVLQLQEILKATQRATDKSLRMLYRD